MYHSSAEYGVNDTTLDFMYVGPLNDYSYNNNDIGDLLIFLKKFAGKNIFLIDNVMTSFDYTKIPSKYDIIIVGIFGELYHADFFKSFFNYFQSKIIIVLTSQNIHPYDYLQKAKIFNLEHVHKSFDFFLRYAVNQNSTSKNNLILKTNKKDLKDRDYTASCLIRRVDLTRLSVLSVFLKNYNFNEIIFSNINSEKFNVTKAEAEEFVTKFNNIKHVIDPVLFNKLLNGPNVSAEFIVFLKKNIKVKFQAEILSKLQQYYYDKDYSLSLITYSENFLSDYNQIFNNHIEAYSNTILNYVLETSIENDVIGNFLTEKTFKPIASKMPFILLSCKGSYGRLKNLGFETFEDVFHCAQLDYSDFDKKIFLLDSVMNTVTKDYLYDNISELQDKVNYNFSWLDNHFYNHCEKMNKDSIEKICEYINDM